MKSGIRFRVAVVGVLLLGGAATGTTYASWTDGATLPPSSLGAGTIGLTVDDTTSVTFADLATLALNTGDTPGAAQSFSAVLRNASSGRNMRMRMYVDDVTATQSDLNGGLQVALAGVDPNTACPTPTWQGLSATNAVQLTAGSLPPGGQRKLCVALRVAGNAPAATAGKTGSLQFSFRGAQVVP